MLRKFWKVENCNSLKPALSLDEKSVIKNFENTHSRAKSGRFITPLPRKANVTPFREYRPKAAKRFLKLEQSLAVMGSSSKLIDTMHECFKMGHAEPVPAADSGKDCKDVYYLPMHVVTKASSTMTKFCILFNA